MGFCLWPQQKLQSLDYCSSPCTLEGGEAVPVSVYHICNSSTDFKIILCCMEEMHAAKWSESLMRSMIQYIYNKSSNSNKYWLFVNEKICKCSHKMTQIPTSY